MPSESMIGYPDKGYRRTLLYSILRVWKRNSTEESARSDIEKLKTDLIKCKHQPQKLEELQKNMNDNLNSDNQSSRPSKEPVEADPTTETITAVTSYFNTGASEAS